MSASNICSHCGAPRREGERACAFCKTVYADAVGGGGAAPRGPAGVSAKVVQAIQAGNIIEAIKQHREDTGLGLREAKDAVEAAKRQLRL